jgi:(heptosyl)LPS beta-1,4-glucosyltransferase
VVLARDEQDHLDGCLASLAWADRVQVLVDAATRDRTAEIARRHTEHVIVLPFDGFSRQRNAGLRLAQTDWVLFVDADERVLPALAGEVRRATDARGDLAGYWIPRRNLILGRWVRHAGWWPDRQLRLLRRGRAHYDESRTVHEVAELTGPSGVLTEPLLHLNYESLAEFRAKQARYALLQARILRDRGVRARPRNLILQPAREFWRRYLELAGYREAALGLILSAEMARATFVTYRELLALQRGKPSAPRDER